MRKLSKNKTDKAMEIRKANQYRRFNISGKELKKRGNIKKQKGRNDKKNTKTFQELQEINL